MGLVANKPICILTKSNQHALLLARGHTAPIHIHIYIYTYTYTYIDTYTYIYIYIYVDVYAYMYICIYSNMEEAPATSAENSV